MALGHMILLKTLVSVLRPFHLPTFPRFLNHESAQMNTNKMQAGEGGSISSQPSVLSPQSSTLPTFYLPPCICPLSSAIFNPGPLVGYIRETAF